MKKTKLFMATGTLVLAISAIFATKANKKFAQVTTAYNGDFYAKVFATGDIFTTCSGTGQNTALQLYVQFVTGSSSHNKFTFTGNHSSNLETISTHHPLYFK